MKEQSWLWGRFGGLTLVMAVIFYFVAAFVPLPDWLGRLAAFAFGPVLTLSFLGWYRYLATRRNGPVLQSACLCGIIAGVLVTSMLVVQLGNNIVREETSAADAPWHAVNRVQYLLDVAWDIYICIAITLLGVALFSDVRFGKMLGGTGVAAGILLLGFNLQAFPHPPAEVGSIDLGPLVAVWMLVAGIRLLVVSKREVDSG